jgi:Large-conductance mechanosensitive channel, MscL
VVEEPTRAEGIPRVHPARQPGRPRGRRGDRHRLHSGGHVDGRGPHHAEIAAIGGEPNFSAVSFTINESAFRYGDFINALIAFLIVAAVVFFFVIKPVNALLSRLRTEPPVAEETRQCPECLSDIPVAARRCAFCATQVAAA